MAATSKTAQSRARTVKPETDTSAPAKTKAAAPRKAAASDAEATAPRRRSTGKAKLAQPITAEDRLRFIEVAAYYLAEQRGFCGGDAAADWLAAEQQVDSLLLAGRLPT